MNEWVKRSKNAWLKYPRYLAMRLIGYTVYSLLAILFMQDVFKDLANEKFTAGVTSSLSLFFFF